MAATTQNFETSYSGVLSAIREKMESVKTCETITGNELLGKAYRSLNESTTPILDLKEFTTNAEKVAEDDATLADIVNFCKSKVKTGDLNFLINLCKEEHFKEMNRMYHPSPESTVESFKVMFTESPTVIEQGIKNGIFDSMKSNLLGVLKQELNEQDKEERTGQIPSQTVSEQNLNESVESKGSLIKYAPIGVKFEDAYNNVVHLMENNVIRFNEENGTVHCLNESEIKDLDIPVSYRRLMTALTQLKYNPLNESFTLRENWDFNLVLRDGVCTVNGKEISGNDIKQLLLESVQCYETFPGKVEGFNKLAYMRDADNMVMLVENFNKLLKYDNLETVKNLNESSYIIIDRRNTVVGHTPAIVSAHKMGNTPETNKLFESYSALNDFCTSVLNESMGDLFAKQIKSEAKIESERNEHLTKLNEDIAQLNKVIRDAEDVRAIAEEGSPARREMDHKLHRLNESLREKLEQVNYYQHEYGK